MKILHVLDERWDSGLTAYGLASARAMAGRGHDVRVAARAGTPAWDQAQAAKLDVVPLGGTLSVRKHVVQGMDVLNAHTGSGHVLSFWATRGTRTALVRTRAEARKLARRPGQGFLFRRTDGVIAASRALADAYHSVFPFLHDRLRVVYPGVEPAASAEGPPGPFRAGILGRLDPVKGHRYFLEAVAQMKERLTDEEFLIAGEEKNLSRQSLEETAAALGVTRWVKFLGRVPDARAFIRSCHAGVVASVGSEAVSRAALEWLAEGRPVAATEVGALPEIVLSGDNGFVVPPASAAGLARALKAFAWEPETRRRMAERALRTAQSRFGFDRFGEETEAAYKDAMRARGKT